MLFIVPDLSFRNRCLTMTILAQLNDCHCCNDARSIVQKKGAEKLQVSVFLPNDLSLHDWYAGVYALLTVWPDVSIMGARNLRRVVGYDFHYIRKKHDVPCMWGNIRPRWRLLQQYVETKGPGWCSLAEREERLFTNRSNRPGDGVLHRTSHGSFVSQLHS